MSIIFYLNTLILKEISACSSPVLLRGAEGSHRVAPGTRGIFVRGTKWKINLAPDWSTWRKPTGTWGEHANSTKKGPDPDIRTFLRWDNSSNHRTTELLSSAQFRRHHLSQRAVQPHSFIGFKSRHSQSALKQTNKMNSGDGWAVGHTQIAQYDNNNNMINKQ